MTAAVGRVTGVARAAAAAEMSVPAGHVTLRHDQRRLRRRLLAIDEGGAALIDLPATTTLDPGDTLLLEDGRRLAIRAADEALYEVRGRDAQHLAEIAWHLGNRHLPVEIDWGADGGPRLRIVRDHVMATMLTGLGATVIEITAPFSPLHGAYQHAHDHALLSR